MAIEDNENNTLRETLEDAVDKVIPDENNDENGGQQIEEVNAPDFWSDEDKNRFQAITDPETRKWLLSRDEGYTSKLTEYENRYKGFNEIFEPYKDRLAQSGQQPVQVVKNLLDAQMVLEDPTRRDAGFMWLAQHYGVDLRKLVGASSDENNQDVNPDAWMDELDPGMKQFLLGLKSSVEKVSGFAQGEVEQRIQQQQNNVNSAITEFRQTKDDKGQPAYPFLSDDRVTRRMATLIKTGEVELVAGDLKSGLTKAYDQAVFSFPDLREKLTPKQEPVTKDRLLAARKAGSSVRGVGASHAQPASKGGLRDQLNEAAQEVGFLS